MDSEKTKAQAFVELLPDIYYRIIILRQNYRAVCKWLLEQHNLDLFAKKDADKDVDERSYQLFSNYLSRHGNVAEARRNYEENVASKIDVEKDWWRDYIDENNRPIKNPNLIGEASKSLKEKDIHTSNEATKPEQSINALEVDVKSGGSKTADTNQNSVSEEVLEPLSQVESAKQPDPTNLTSVFGVKSKARLDDETLNQDLLADYNQTMLATKISKH